MKKLSELWTSIWAHFDQLSLRERVLVLVASLVVVQLLWDLALSSPEQTERAQRVSAVGEEQQRISALELQIKGLAGRMGQDPDALLRDRLATVSQSLEDIQGRIAEAANTLIGPTEMAQLLEQLLLQQKGLKLLRLERMQTRALLGGKTDQVTLTAGHDLFSHGFAIEFEGDYFSTLDYLRSLEMLPWRFFWDAVSYQVREYPRSRVRIELHTLSLSEDWIGV